MQEATNDSVSIRSERDSFTTRSIIERLAIGDPFGLELNSSPLVPIGRQGFININNDSSGQIASQGHPTDETQLSYTTMFPAASALCAWGSIQHNELPELRPLVRWVYV